MNIENIDKVISIMGRIHESNFYIGSWQSNSYSDNIFDEKQIVECGTTCCISGWMRVSAEFRDLQDPECLTSAAFIINKEHLNWTEENSIAEVLGISESLASRLIYAGSSLYIPYVEEYNKKNDPYGELLETLIKPKHVIAILEDIKAGKIQ